MKYQQVVAGKFVDRPNRFLAHVELEGVVELVHVKNTGRCRELLTSGAVVFVAPSNNPKRRTKWDLIGVQKGERLIQIDSQAPNRLVWEWLKMGNLISKTATIRREVTYGKSRFDLLVEEETGKRIFIEVKGVTLETDGVVYFPDAPSKRAVKHIYELCQAKQEGYEAWIFFVVQMKQARYFTPNRKTHPEFCEALSYAEKQGVRLIAYTCRVQPNQVSLERQIPIRLIPEKLYEAVPLLLQWYRKNCRTLPWRSEVSAYHTWVSEIMLQQTRVEAVKPFYHRFLEELPTVEALAGASEDKLLKLWEGLGYYNRVRNMQKAAREIMECYGGELPRDYEALRRLPGIGAYTAGAIASIAFGLPKPAVDGNVLRVMARLTAETGDILEKTIHVKIEQMVEQLIPMQATGDFNQSLIELGALICLPNGAPVCEKCPVKSLCRAYCEKLTDKLPVRRKGMSRKIVHRTILLIRDGKRIAIRKRPGKGLLAGLYELPGLEQSLSIEEVAAYSKKLGVMPIKITDLGRAKHVFSHIEWHMVGYEVRVDELEPLKGTDLIFAEPTKIRKTYPIPSAFEHYTKYV